MSRISPLSAFITLLITACSALSPVPTPTPTHTFTPIPSDTPLPTLTSTATNTPQPTQTEDVLSSLRPVGTPQSAWKGIPIMPGALAGSADDDSYNFTIQATADEIQSYYESELSKSSWTLMASGAGDTGALMLIFNNGAPPLMTISIIPDGDLMIVLIVNSQ